MKNNNRKGFTIVELVIVIAVIAILAGVLIPTFSTVVGKANQSAALQTARSTLTNALNMSSTAQLTGTDTYGEHTYFLVNGYAYAYNGNELIAKNYPAEGSLLSGAKYTSQDNSSVYYYDKTFNTILIAADNLDTASKVIKNVGDVITKVTDINSNKIFVIDDKYYMGVSYVEEEIVEINNKHYVKSTVTVEGDSYSLYSNQIEGQNVEANVGDLKAIQAQILVNSDFSKDVVVLTCFNY